VSKFCQNLTGVKIWSKFGRNLTGVKIWSKFDQNLTGVFTVSVRETCTEVCKQRTLIHVIGF
jgi:hypothetical protein